jgi:predicted nucleic acid-binding protein
MEQIPPAVKAELAHANTPAIVRVWISQPSPWLEVVSLKQPVDSALAHLDAGEREAISLASELQAILLLMDERDGVTIARHRGLKVVGTPAALDIAAAHGLVELQTMFERLRATTFRSWPDYAVDYGSRYVHRALKEIDVAPFQTKQLALPQTGQYRKENQGSFSKCLNCPTLP